MAEADNAGSKDAGRVPPQDIDAERSLLGAVLISENILADVTEITRPEDFYDARHKLVFEAMWNLYEKHRPVDLLTLTAELRGRKQLKDVGGGAYLTELTNAVPTATHAKAYAELVAKAAVKRRLIKAGEGIVQRAYGEDTEIAEMLGEAEKELFSVSEQNVKQDLVAMSDILVDTFDRIELLHRNKGALRGMKTGYVDLDSKTAGFQKSDLLIIAARPAMGKTTLALNMAYNVATINKKDVLVFSLEMSKDQLVDRMLADVSGVDSWKLRTGNLSGEDFEKISEAMAEMAEAPIHIDDTPGLSILEMRTKARRVAHDKDIGLIIVDYLQLMSSSSRKAEANRVQEVSEISRGLKLIARELQVPVIALSQLSRSVENRMPQIPQLSDLRESGSIEQDADMVMFVYREDYYNPETERQHITDLIIAKHRNGPTGTVELYFDPARLRFMSLDSKRE